MGRAGLQVAVLLFLRTSYYRTLFLPYHIHTMSSHTLFHFHLSPDHPPPFLHEFHLLAQYPVHRLLPSCVLVESIKQSTLISLTIAVLSFILSLNFDKTPAHCSWYKWVLVSFILAKLFSCLSHLDNAEICLWVMMNGVYAMIDYYGQYKSESMYRKRAGIFLGGVLHIRHILLRVLRNVEGGLGGPWLIYQLQALFSLRGRYIPEVYGLYVTLTYPPP